MLGMQTKEPTKAMQVKITTQHVVNHLEMLEKTYIVMVFKTNIKEKSLLS